MNRIYKMMPLLVLLLLAVVAVCFASDEAGGGRKLWDMLWRVINFIILVAILWKLLADKAKAFFSDRRTEIAQMLDDANKAKDAAEKLLTENEQKMKNVEKDISEVREMLIGEIENEKARIIEEGKESAARIINQAKLSAEQEVLRARKELRDQVIDMAGDMAQGLVTKNITPEDQERILEEYLNKVVREN